MVCRQGPAGVCLRKELIEWDKDFTVSYYCDIGIMCVCGNYSAISNTSTFLPIRVAVVLYCDSDTFCDANVRTFIALCYCYCAMLSLLFRSVLCLRAICVQCSYG